MQSKFFYKNLELLVFDSVYEPREDSVLLADAIKESDVANKRVLDLGCGSGLQGINALSLGAKRVVFADINEKALQNAKANAKKLWFEKRCAFKKSDLFSSLEGKRFYLIVFNPPYVDSGKTKKWLDTDGGKKGRELLDRFLKQIKAHLEKNGKVFFVQSSLNGEAKTRRLLKEQGFDFEVTARKRLFFEELLIFSCRPRL